MHLLELNRLGAVGDSRILDVRGHSRAIWSDCPWFDLINGTRDGMAFHDDFNRSMIQAANVAASATTLPDPWVAFTDSTAASTIASAVEPSSAVGAVTLNITTANEGIHMGLFTQKNLGTIISGTNLAGTAGLGLASAASTPFLNKVWLEARLKVSTVAANEISFFFGLMEKARVITLGTIATGSAAPAAVDHFGWFKAGGGTVAAQTFISDGTATVQNATAATLVADTYINLGLTWDGTSGTLGLGKFWVNGVADATTVTSATTQFPLAEGLSPYIGAISGSTAGDDIVTVDWVRFAFLRTV